MTLLKTVFLRKMRPRWLHLPLAALNGSGCAGI